jgi:Ankyrin repeats (3 copies)
MKIRKLSVTALLWNGLVSFLLIAVDPVVVDALAAAVTAPVVAISNNNKQRSAGSSGTGGNIYKHIFRDYADVSFDSWLRCCDPRDFLISVGYTETELQTMEEEYPSLLSQNVHGQLAPKIRFLVEVLHAGYGEMTWHDNESGPAAPAAPTIRQQHEQHQDVINGDNAGDDEEECPVIVHPPGGGDDDSIPHSMRLTTKDRIPTVLFFKCQLDRSIGPKHAYLAYHNLPHGRAVLDRLEDFLLACETSAKFADWCNALLGSDSTPAENYNGLTTTAAHTHSAHDVDAFQIRFGQGLIPAVRGGNDPAFVKVLLAHGSNVFESDRNHVSPLHWAAGSGQAAIVRLIVSKLSKEHGVPVGQILLEEREPKQGATALHWACCGIRPGQPIGKSGGSYEVCSLLLHLTDAGHRRDVATAKTYTAQGTPLHWAAWSGSTRSVLKLLCQYGADPHARDCNGATPVHWAAAAGHVSSYWFENNVNLFVKDAAGKTPEDYATLYGRTNVIEWLQSVRSQVKIGQ